MKVPIILLGIATLVLMLFVPPMNGEENRMKETTYSTRAGELAYTWQTDTPQERVALVLGVPVAFAAAVFFLAVIGCIFLKGNDRLEKEMAEAQARRENE